MIASEVVKGVICLISRSFSFLFGRTGVFISSSFGKLPEQPDLIESGSMQAFKSSYHSQGYRFNKSTPMGFRSHGTTPEGW